jgi:hypothetical protein
MPRRTVPRTRAEARKTDGGLDRRKVRLTQEQRAERNALIMQYYLASRPERWIAAHPRVLLSQQRVHQIIAEQLKSAASRQGLLSEHAMTVYVERLELLWGRVAPKVMDADPEHGASQLKAVEVGRRILEQFARLYDLNEERTPVLMPPMSDDELDMLDEDSPAYQSLDDLTRYRLRAHRKEASR